MDRSASMSRTGPQPDRRTEVAAVVADIRTRIRDLDIAMTGRARGAQSWCRWCATATSRARSARSTASTAPAASKNRSSRNACRDFARTTNSRILHSDVIIVADAGDFVFYDCVYEELLQSLGPINDDTTVPWTMFNDDVQMGFFGLYDQYLLNILYDRRIRPGMTRAEVEALLPEVLPQVRALGRREQQSKAVQHDPESGHRFSDKIMPIQRALKPVEPRAAGSSNSPPSHRAV